MQKEDINNLVEAAKDFDYGALAELCEYFYPKVFGYVFYRVKTREDAEDITGEVFVRMMRSLESQKGFFPAWLFRIASNLVNDYYRQSKRENETPLQEATIASGKDPEGIMIENDLKRALGKLTPAQQEVITLKFMEGYENREIAEILGKSVGAVKVLQFRALQAMRQYLGER